MLRWLALVLMLGLALITLACSSDGEPRAVGTSSQELTQTAEAGGITVEARWLTEGELTELDADVSRYPLDVFVLFELALDTHSGDLNDIDLQDAAMLTQGPAVSPPEAWVSESDDSHHRSGVLVFPLDQQEGEVGLTVDLGDEEVALLWEGPPTK